jgi:hypothetical protein
MPVNFDSKALDMFRNVQFGSTKAIAKLDGDTLKSDGNYHGPLGKLFRLSATRAENNAVRTQLLKSLGQAFGIDGMTEFKDGTVTFSKDFMDKLERLLGPEFKRDDFGIDRNGNVDSGKPLTARRITAIMKQAKIAGKSEFSIPIYEEKLADIQKQLKALPKDDINKAVIDHFNTVKKVLDFLKNDMPNLVEENEIYKYYVEDCNDEEGAIKQGYAKYDLNDKTTGEKVPLHEDKIDPVMKYIDKRAGVLIHLELNATKPELVNAYVQHEMESFVKLSIDIFNDAKLKGVQGDFFKRLKDPGACLEEKTKRLMAFQEKHDLKEQEPQSVNAPKAVAFNKIADHDKKTALHDCILLEIGAFDDAHPGQEFDKWEDYADAIKENLVGIERPLSEATKTEKGLWEFKTVTDGDGNPVVKKLTAEDIDKIGPACVEYVTIY